MNDDMYLSLVVDLYKSGAWNKETVIKKLTLYAQEKNDPQISDFVDNFVRSLNYEYTIDQKKIFLANIKLMNDDELKYGDAVDNMSEDTINRIYAYEVENLSKEEIERLDNIVVGTLEPEIEEINIPNDWYTPLEHEDDVKVGNWYAPLNTEEKIKLMQDQIEELVAKSKESELARVNETLNLVEEKPVVSEERIKLVEDQIEELVEKSKESEIIIVDENLQHGEELKEETEVDPYDFSFQVPELEPVSENLEGDSEEVVVDVEDDLTNVDTDTVVIGDIFGMAETEEEFQNVAYNLNSFENDSSVEHVEATKDRIENLKMSKGKVKNYFLKTAIVVSIFALSSFTSTVPVVAGYLIIANQIQKGKFNPKNKFESVLKSTFEKFMYMGMSPEEIQEERGKSR